MNPYIHIDRNKFKIKKGKMKRKRRPERCPLNSKPILQDGFVLWIVESIVNILEKSRLIETFIIGQMDRTPVSVAILMQMCDYTLWGRWMSPFQEWKIKRLMDACREWYFSSLCAISNIIVEASTLQRRRILWSVTFTPAHQSNNANLYHKKEFGQEPNTQLASVIKLV